MAMSGWSFIRGVAVGAIGAAAMTVTYNLYAQATTIEFVIPIGTAISTASEKIVFIQKSTTNDTVGNCAAGEHPVQTLVAVDPAGGAAKISGVIVTSQTDSVAPGTRLGALSAMGTCGTNNEFQKFRGEVQ